MDSIITKKQLEKTVKITKNGSVVNSDNIAKIFDKQHKAVLKSIRLLSEKLVAQNYSTNKYFKDSSYIDSRGKEYPRFNLTRKGFDLLVLGFTGEKALKYKLWYIDEFHNKDEIIIKDKLTAKTHLQNDMFIELRDESKTIRKAFAEAIQQYELPQRVAEKKDATRFVGLRAIAYTKLVYKKLNLTIPKGVNPRDVFKPVEVMKITILEDKITNMIKNNATNSIYYKDSYKQIKKDILEIQ
jgi:Rha family phage regulatory protein